MDIRTMEQKLTTFRCPSPPYSSNGLRLFRQGFTLAEVLITLTIIGIIAAMTIPSLMTKVQDHGFRSAFLKNYAIIKNAYAMSIRDGVPFWDPTEDPEANWTISPTYQRNSNLIKDYFKVQKDIHGRYDGNGWLTFNNFYKGKNMNTLFKKLNGDYIQNFMLNGSALTFQLDDGTVLSFRSGDGLAYIVFIDVNGPKEPNTYGRDIYHLQATWDATLGRFEIHPYGDPHTGGTLKAENGEISNVESNCKMSGYGSTCAYEIIKNRSFKIPKE